jgi:hypothetical protein
MGGGGNRADENHKNSRPPGRDKKPGLLEQALVLPVNSNVCYDGHIKMSTLIFRNDNLAKRVNKTRLTGRRKILETLPPLKLNSETLPAACIASRNY